MSETPLYQCRLCLTNSKLYYSLLDEGVNGVIESFTPIKIKDNDGLSTYCCSNCLEEIYLVDKIRCRIVESDRILREEQQKQTPASNQEIIENNDNKPVIIIIKNEISDNVNSSKLIVTNNDSIMNLDLNQADEQSSSMEKLQNDQILMTTCEICFRQIQIKNYQRHMSLHNSTQQICELCGAVAKNSESLRGHMFYMHKCTSEEYKCDQCGKFYRYKYKFLLHMRKAHGGERTHICEICGKSFYTGRDVNRHIKMKHLKLRPYKCQYCNKNFCSTSSLQTHIRQHTNEKPYKCDVCSESFRQKISLKTHLKSKHAVILNTNGNN